MALSAGLVVAGYIWRVKPADGLEVEGMMFSMKELHPEGRVLHV